MPTSSTFTHQVGRAPPPAAERLPRSGPRFFDGWFPGTPAPPLPSAALGIERATRLGDNVALLGIGSGLNALMLGMCTGPAVRNTRLGRFADEAR
jgi:hypothetical protein